MFGRFAGAPHAGNAQRIISSNDRKNRLAEIIELSMAKERREFTDADYRSIPLPSRIASLSRVVITWLR